MGTALAAPHEYRFTVGEALADIPAVMAAIDACAAQHGLSDDQRYATQVCLEEALANLILHARPRSSTNRNIEASLIVDGGRARILVSDACNPFDASKPPAPDSDPQAVGGRGLRLLHAFAKRLEYRREGNRNVLDIEI